jgi:hypothetical protein
MARTTTGTFTGTGQSAAFSGLAPAVGSQALGKFNLSLWGTFSATVVLQRSFDGSTWLNCAKPDLTDASFTAPISLVVEEPEPGASYRLNCTGGCARKSNSPLRRRHPDQEQQRRLRRFWELNT